MAAEARLPKESLVGKDVETHFHKHQPGTLVVLFACNQHVSESFESNLMQRSIWHGTDFSDIFVRFCVFSTKLCQGEEISQSFELLCFFLNGCAMNT